jgi:hypothetical protein
MAEQNSIVYIYHIFFIRQLWGIWGGSTA